jgi:hypothetical protein
MIYFGGAGSTLVVAAQPLATRKISKKGKKAKISVKYFQRRRHYSVKQTRF